MFMTFNIKRDEVDEDGALDFLSKVGKDIVSATRRPLLTDRPNVVLDVSASPMERSCPAPLK
jgi:hypothetical protein